MENGLIEQIFRYCERAGATGWAAEPVNLASNIAFVLAGIVAYWLRARHPTEPTPDTAILSGLLIAIGLGNAAPSRMTLAADAIPVVLMVVAYLHFALAVFLRATPVVALLGTLTILVVSLGAAAMPGWLDVVSGSLLYLPAWVALVLIAIACAHRRHPATTALFAAAGIFAVALVARALDQPLCSSTTIAGHQAGLHVGWHLGCALALFVLVRAAIRFGHPPGTEAAVRVEILSPVPRGGSKNARGEI
ncbi:MAG: ceramidase domain-containing protein [Pseudomonadota bacterium]